jgi:hypothetical protein
MMLLPNQSQFSEFPDFPSGDLSLIPTQYKGWRISSKVINGKLWVRWQHPQESFPRYGCSIGEAGIAGTVSHIKLFIDLAIRLEEEATKKHRY